jgi:integrase
MSRPKKDGTSAAQPRRRSFTELFLKKVKPEAYAFNAWDSKERGLVLRVQPSGHRAFKFVYRHRGRPRWYHIGNVPLSDARRIAAKVRLSVAEGKDPAAERQAERGAGTFAEMADRYLAEYAKKRNKSWKQGRALVERHLLPRLGKLDAKSITRADVRSLIAKIAAPIVANQVLAAASAIFSWGVKVEIIALNPCRGVDRNETKSRERVLSDSEVPMFWKAFDDAGLVASAALKTILLTGQRPGEVAHMRCEHVKDGWWELPGAPVPEIGWPGTKNAASHRVWLPKVMQDIIAEVQGDEANAGFVFAGPRGRPVSGIGAAMRAISGKLGVEPARPHDLRRTFGSTVTALGFGRQAMDRILNHADNSVGSIYDRHAYSTEDKRIMETVAMHVIELAEGRRAATNVIAIRQA